MLDDRGFEDDTLVRGALEALADSVGLAPRWRVRICKRIPVAAGLGGGSSDAACALALANAELHEPVSPPSLHAIAAAIGADVPFFLREGAQLATRDGTELEAVDLRTDYVVVLVVPHRRAKESTAAVYRSFDTRNGAGFDERRASLLDELTRVEHARDGPAAQERPCVVTVGRPARGPRRLSRRRHGRGPGRLWLFEHAADAERAVAAVSRAGTTWLARPV